MSEKRNWKIAALVSATLCAILPANAQEHRFRVRTTEKLVSVSDPQISPDDKSIAVTAGRTNMNEDGTDTQIVLVNIADGSERVLTSEHKHASSPRWSPHGKRLAFLAESGKEKSATPQIFVLPMDGGEAQKITNAADGVEQFAWRPDGKIIAYVTPDAPDRKAIAEHHDSFRVGDTDYLETTAAEPSHVWIVSAGGGDAKRVTSGSWSLPIVFPPSPPASPLSWSPDGKSLLITRQKTAEPGDSDMSTIQVLDVSTGKIRQLTSHTHLESTAAFSPDGSKVAYWYNKDGDLNNQMEIFVAPITGGDGADVTAAIDRNIQRAIYRDAGDGPGRDVMAGLDTVERIPNVDGNDMAVCGWSYGGYMTSWMIGHYHIWKAAVSGAAVNDLAMEAAVSDGNRENYPSMGGSPWVSGNWELYRKESPVTYAAQVTTPTLILSDTGDFRVPIVQSYEMYHALKDNGKTVEFYAYPVHGHFPGDPVHREDVIRRWIGWLNQYLK